MNYTIKANIGHVAVLLSYFLQIVLLLLMTLVFVPEGKQPNLTVGLILVLPLLPFMPFLIKRSIRAHVWLCYLSLFYFMLAVPSGMDPRYGLIGRIELVNIIFLFVICMCFVRWEQRRLGISVTR